MILNITLSPSSSLLALLMGVAHLRSDLLLRPDWPPELGGVLVGGGGTAPDISLQHKVYSTDTHTQYTED